MILKLIHFDRLIDFPVSDYIDDAKAAPVIAALKSLPGGEYPERLLAERRAAFVRQIEAHPIEARLAAIDAALSEPLDMETVNNLLEEKAELLIRLENEDA